MPKQVKSRGKGKSQRLAPLEVQLKKDEEKKFAQERKVKRSKANKRDNEELEEGISSEMSKKILKYARQQLEEEKELRVKEKRDVEKNAALNESDMEESDVEQEEEEEYEIEYMNTDQFREMQIQEDDERVLRTFMGEGNGKPKGRTLADIIMEKIRERENNVEVDEDAKREELEKKTSLNSKLVEVYKSIATLMKRYRSGKVPKAFKIIPVLRNWEEVLYITEPETWSPQAMRMATTLFASNLNEKMAQRFYALVLVPAVREDIRRSKKLNYHLYMALKKSIYRPGAFFKGILLPLCESQDCTLKEATIIGSVLAKVSIPMLHSAAAMLKMAAMPYSGATSLFLRVLLNKKYSLPYKVIDGLVKHFVAFRKETRELPVLWHQSLLVFAQRYKATLTDDQKEFIKPLLKQHCHPLITVEIRRELFNATSANRVANLK